MKLAQWPRKCSTNVNYYSILPCGISALYIAPWVSLSSFSLSFPFLTFSNFFILHFPSIGNSDKSPENCPPYLHFSKGSFLLLSSYCTLLFSFMLSLSQSFPSGNPAYNCCYWRWSKKADTKKFGARSLPHLISGCGWNTLLYVWFCFCFSVQQTL